MWCFGNAEVKEEDVVLKQLEWNILIPLESERIAILGTILIPLWSERIAILGTILIPLWSERIAILGTILIPL